MYSVELGGSTGLVTAASSSVWKTLISLKLADTTGHRARLRRLVLGGGDDDDRIRIRVRRTNNAADGTSTAVNVNTIGLSDPDQIASIMAAIGTNHSVEPTTFATGVVAGGAFNLRGTLVLEWGPGEGPLWGKNESMCFEALDTGTARTFNGSVDWDEGQ